MAQDGDSGVLDGGDEGGGGCVVCVSGEEGGVLGGADDADGEGAEEVEDDEAVDVASCGLGDVAAGRFHFAGGDDDELGGEDEGDGGLDDALQQADEAAGVPVGGDQVGIHGSRVFPVVEAQALAVGAAAPEEDEGEQQQADEGDDLDAGEPELGLAVDADGEVVEQDDDHDHDGDPDGEVHGIGPVLDDERRSDDLVGDQDAQRVPVEVAHGEAHAARDVAEAVVAHGAAVDGQVCADLCDAGDDAVDER